MQYGNCKVVSYIYTYTFKDITDITERFEGVWGWERERKGVQSDLLTASLAWWG